MGTDGRVTDPWAVGLAHERSVGDDDRRSRGAWYTPRSVVEAVVERAIPPDRIPRRVLDPTCGGGAFLLGVLDRMVALGVAPADAIGRVSGIDLDRGAAAAAEAALDAWAAANGVTAEAASVIVGDALDVDAGPTGLDLVVGNPPFASPLKRGAVPERANAFRQDRPGLFGPYADLAAVHLAAAVDRIVPGGRVAMVLPQSILSSRHVGGLRQHLDAEAPVQAVWATAASVFDANVRVWAPVFERGGTPAADRWPALVADELGVPPVELRGMPTGDRVSATAGFRDEYYALAAACCEAEDGEPADRIRIATVGSVDPLVSLWGRRPTRFAKQTWHRPVVDEQRLDERSREWLAAQLRPKVLLPTQSRVFEPLVDRSGRLAPVTPLIAIHGAPEELDRIAAMLLAPPLVAWAHRRWFGTALSVEAIKLAARDVAELPTPTDRVRWDAAASLVSEADVCPPRDVGSLCRKVGQVMTEAYEADFELYRWWEARLPSDRADDASSPNS